MKRFLNPALVAITTCAALSLAACGSSTDTTTGGTTTEDATTGGDTTISDTGSDATTTTDTTTTADVQTKDVPPAPCGGPCKNAGEKCDTKTDKCYLPCDGKCTASQFCDESAGAPGTCKDTAALPTKWGIDGDGKVQKVTSLAIAKAADGCDLNGDGKPDNKLNALASLAGGPLSDSITKGQVVLLFEPLSFVTDGTAFTFDLLIGDVDASDTAHDPTTAGGKYTVQKASYDPATGKPLVAFSDAKIKAGALTAAADKFFLNLSIQGINLSLTISKPSLTGTVTDDKTWIDTKAAKLCGYITKADLEGAINALPDSTFAGLGMTKAQVLGLLPTLLAPDLDMDDDGVKEAISLALNMETLGGTITGFTPAKAP